MSNKNLQNGLNPKDLGAAVAKAINVALDDLRATKAENVRLREALKWAISLFKQEGECSVECFERVGLLFRKETGYLRPGKDCVIHDPEVRQAEWDKWMAENMNKAKSLLKEADNA